MFWVYFKTGDSKPRTKGTLDEARALLIRIGDSTQLPCYTSGCLNNVEPIT